MKAPATERSFVRRHLWLLLRRLSQLGILGLFLTGPWLGIWIVKGNLAASLTLDMLPLTDPYVLAQSVVAGFLPGLTALIGGLIVVVFYLLVGGRSYCAWVCPINPVTDLAAWLRRRLDLRGTGLKMNRNTRFWILGATLLASAIGGTLAWEWLNPVSILHRGLIFGFGFGWSLVLAIFLFDLFISRHGWCGHLCPVGAAYSLIGRAAVLRVAATDRDRCNDCMDCYKVCPEPQVIRPALKGRSQGAGPLIRSAQCTHCARCIDVCQQQVFRFSTRFAASGRPQPTSKTEAST